MMCYEKEIKGKPCYIPNNGNENLPGGKKRKTRKTK